MSVAGHSHINIFVFTLDLLTFVGPSILSFLSTTFALRRKERFISLFYPLQLSLPLSSISLGSNSSYRCVHFTVFLVDSRV